MAIEEVEDVVFELADREIAGDFDLLKVLAIA